MSVKRERLSKVVYEEIKQWLIAVSAKLQKYDWRSNQFQLKKLFKAKQKINHNECSMRNGMG